eukprot:419446-Pleurochrysis_carterae.AAC.1
MEYSSLEAAGHVLPKGWDFPRDGAWRCRHCDREVWSSEAEYEAERARISDLISRADEDEDVKKELSKLLSAHAATHLDA